MPHGHPFAIVDAFTTGRPSSGNPAGVVVLDAFPEDAWMQGVADELHQAETAFVVPGADGVFALRWFTPLVEVALCGHATLAAAHRLWEAGVLDADEPAVFATRSGRLVATRDGERIVLDLPAAPAVPVPAAPGLLAALAGAVPVWTGTTEHPEPVERNALAVLATEAAVRDLVPDLAAVAALPVGGVIVTARRGDGGVVSRCFAPAIGIPEDPVTGSAHATIGPYWRQELGDVITAEQASRRGGELVVTTTGTGRVLVAGTARTAVTGLLL